MTAALLGFGLLWVVGAKSAEPAAVSSAGKFTFVRGGILSSPKFPDDTFVIVNSKRPLFHGPLSDPQVELTSQVGMLDFLWHPGERYDVVRRDAGGRHGGDRAVRAPELATPYPLWKIPLEDVRDAAAGGTWPDCVVQFSPDNRRLAIGSFEGWLRIVDCFTGVTLWSERLAEGMIKRLAWTYDGLRLYVGEQSPDGRLLAYDLGKESEGQLRPHLAWSVRLADQLESSQPPAHDRFGIYTLPAIYDLQLSEDGRVFVAGTHRWNANGKPQSRSLLACYTADGKQSWQFPSEKPSEATTGLTFFAIDPGGKRVAFLATPPERAHSSGSQSAANFVQLDGLTGAVVGRVEIQPLKPHFDRVESWDSTSISLDGNRGVLGLNDGRALLFELSSVGPTLLREIDLATPTLVGGTPIAASASYARFHGNLLCLQTQNTHIPFGNSQAANRPPIAHRGANTLTVCDADGNRLWLYRGPFSLSGSWADRRGRGKPRWLVVACREEPGSLEAGNFGLLAFNLRAEGSGIDKLVYYYPTEGPAMFSADISPDGHYVAVAETPTTTPDGRDLYGTYQVHVIH